MSHVAVGPGCWSWDSGPEKRVLAKPARGAVELWELKNSAGGWTHPIHIHLVDFQIISRTDGDRAVLPYEKVALKDVVWLNKNERVRVLARYAPWDGLYMFHCHNLIHEDHDMMAAMNVTALTDLGYTEKTSFLDPMDPAYRAKSFSDTDLDNRQGDFSGDSIEAKIKFFKGLEAYSHASDVESALEAYWKTASTLSTSTVKSITTSTKSTSTTSSVSSASATSTSKATSLLSTASTTTKSNSSSTKVDDKTTKTSSTSTKTTTTSAKK